KPGMTAAEIGCGLGTVAGELAAIVGPTGKVYGFDLSEQFIAAARSRAEQRREDVATRAPLDFKVADALALPLPHAALDAYRAERVYMHIQSSEAALAEAFRVLRPGGRLLTMDQDWDSLVFDGELATTRKVTRAFADSLMNGMVARRMRPLLREAGF